MADQAGEKRGLRERLAEGAVICAEGYVFELERRGYLQAGGYVPEVLLGGAGGGRDTAPRFPARWART